MAIMDQKKANTILLMTTTRTTRIAYAKKNSLRPQYTTAGSKMR